MLSSGNSFGQYKIYKNLNMKGNIIYKLKLRAGFRENNFVNLYHQLIPDQELPPMDLVIALFYKRIGPQ